MPHASGHEPFRAPAADRVSRRVLLYVAFFAASFLVGGPVAIVVATDAGYTAEGTLWIGGASRPAADGAATPTAPDITAMRAWVELLRSYRVLDAVVLEQQLHVDHAGEDAAATVRGAAQDLARRLAVEISPGTNDLRVALSGSDPQRVTDVLNAVLRTHADVALQLKTSRLGRTLTILEEQLEAMERELAEAERDLERFRVATVLGPPGETIAATEPGAEEQRLSRRVQTAQELYDQVRDRAATARLSASSATPDVRVLDSASVTERRGGELKLLVAVLVLFGFLGAGGAFAFLAERVLSRR